jgi:hypothetical protein
MTLKELSGDGADFDDEEDGVGAILSTEVLMRPGGDSVEARGGIAVERS